MIKDQQNSLLNITTTSATTTKRYTSFFASQQSLQLYSKSDIVIIHLGERWKTTLQYSDIDQLTNFTTQSQSRQVTGLFQRINFDAQSDPCCGVVTWSAQKSLWWTGMTVTWLLFGASTISYSSIAVFIILTSIILCLGHSIGMHRKLIHESFDSPKPFERLLIYLGTLVGLGGPFTMMYTHDMRDWAQRQPQCHPFLSHQNSIYKDFIWQIHHKLHLTESPEFSFPKDMQQDTFYRYLQATSMLQQLPVAAVLFYFGGWAWVVWGVCARVSVSVFGHWLIGYFAHNSGQRDWHLDGAAVQGYNVRYLGTITFGECWHNNHHAFPGSSKLGIEKNQFDPGWLVLNFLKRFKLVSNLRTPEDLPRRANLSRLTKKTNTNTKD